MARRAVVTRNPRLGAHSGAANVGVQPNAFLRDAGQVFREPRPTNARWHTRQGKNRLEDEDDDEND
jgi:hypothetical protein